MIATVQLNIGGVLLETADLDAARPYLYRRARTFQKPGQYLWLVDHAQRSRAPRPRTGANRTRSEAEESGKLAAKGDQTNQLASAQVALAEILREQGDDAGARNLLEAALQTRRNSGEKLAAAGAWLRLAVLEAGRQNWPAAERLTGDAPALLDRAGRRGAAALAGSIAASAMLAQGERSAACRLVVSSEALAGKAEDRLDAMRARIRLAGLDPPCGAGSRAARTLAGVILQARAAHLVRMEREARAAQAPGLSARPQPSR